jgi:hypothetical protein
MRKQFAWAGIGGAVFGAALTVSWLWWLFPVGVFTVLYLARSATSGRQAIVLGWVFGFVKAGIVCSFLFMTYPLDWAELPPGLYQLGIIASYWVPTALTVGFGSACIVGALYLARGYGQRLWWPLFVGGVWVLGDLVGSLVYSLAALGPGSTIQTHFSFGWLGYALAWQPQVVQLAQLGGVFLLTIVAAGYVSWWQQLVTRRWWAVAGLVLAVVASYTTNPSVPTSMNSITVAAVATSWSRSTAPVSIINAKERQVREAATAAVSTGADYVLLPEDSRLTQFLGGIVATENWLANQSSTTILVDSGRTQSQYGTVLRAHIYHPTEGILASFDKQYTVPQGEYTPYLYQGIITRLAKNTPAADAIADISYRPGINQLDLDLSAAVPGVLFCFENILPTAAWRLTDDQTDTPFIAHLVSHGWFSRPPNALLTQLDAMLKVQAVWSQKPIVMASNESGVMTWLSNGGYGRSELYTAGAGWQVYRVTIPRN